MWNVAFWNVEFGIVFLLKRLEHFVTLCFSAMASTTRTSWTNQTVDLLRNNPHVDCKPVLKKLVPATLEKGIRFVSIQRKATEGARHVRLEGWYYIRPVGVDEVLRALRETGFWTQQLQKEVVEIMKSQRVYHVVIRGNDPRFMPLGRCDGQDLVTDFCCERFGMIVEEVEKHLFEELPDPANIRLAMADHSFDQMLQHYYLSGKHDKDATLHLVGRFRGGSNLLHTCIKEGFLETLKLLLDDFTLESQSKTPWRVLAEPLRPVGQYKVTAFHRAVYDGRPECLQQLVGWAERHGHDIKELRNAEERDIFKGPSKGLTCLELAEECQNLACYNLLAPLFGVLLKERGADANPREARLEQRILPRIEVEVPGEEQPLIYLADREQLDWTWVIQTIKSLKGSNEFRSLDTSQSVIKLQNLALEVDSTEEQVANFLTETSGMNVEADACTWKTDKTALTFLKVVVDRVRSHPADVDGHHSVHLPRKLHISSVTAEDLPLVEEEKVDKEVGELLLEFVAQCGRWVGFMGARGGLISTKQRQRVALLGPSIQGAVLAAVYATRVSAFLGHASADVDGEGLGLWLRIRELMPLARSVLQWFFDQEKLLTEEPADVSQNVDPAVVPFLKMTLTAWFQSADVSEEDPDAWATWAQKLRLDEDLLKKELAPALDLVLESLLRMWKALDPVCKRSGYLSVADLVKNCIPRALLSRLTESRARLEKWSMPPKKSKISLTEKTSILGPSSKLSLKPKSFLRPLLS